MDPKLKSVLKSIPGGKEVIEKFCMVFPSLNSIASNVTQVNVTQGGAPVTTAVAWCNGGGDNIPSISTVRSRILFLLK